MKHGVTGGREGWQAGEERNDREGVTGGREGWQAGEDRNVREVGRERGNRL